MAGGIRKQSKDTWELTIDLGRDPTTGRRRRRYLTVRGTKREAECALAEALHQRDTGTDLTPARLTVADYLRRWLRDCAAQTVAPSTFARYQEIVEQHLIPALGSLRLRDLRPAHIQAAYRAFSPRDGRGQELSAKTIFEHHAVLREALNWAVRWQLLARNPAGAASPPRPQRREMRVLSPEETQAFLRAARASRLYPLMHLAVATGARLGELLALRWQDVDLERGTMEIARTARFFSGRGVVFGQPKTHRSRRPVALSPERVRVLTEHRRQQLTERLRAGLSWYHTGKPSVVGAATGAVAGLVAITPASGFIGVWPGATDGYLNIMPAIIIGVGAGLFCYLAVQARIRLRLDDSLDVWGVHGIGGTWGAFATGLFAVAAVGGGSGLIDGEPGQLARQLTGIGATWGYAFVVTLVILKVLDAVVGLRVREEEELAGIDISQHGERGYVLEEAGAVAAPGAAAPASPGEARAPQE